MGHLTCESVPGKTENVSSVTLNFTILYSIMAASKSRRHVGSKVKSTGSRSYVWKPGGDILLDVLSRAIEACSEKGGGVLRIVLAAVPPHLSACVLLTRLFFLVFHLHVCGVCRF